MVYCTYSYSIHGVYKPTDITGGPHIVWDVSIESLWNLYGISMESVL